MSKGATSEVERRSEALTPSSKSRETRYQWWDGRTIHRPYQVLSYTENKSNLVISFYFCQSVLANPSMTNLLKSQARARTLSTLTLTCSIPWIPPFLTAKQAPHILIVATRHKTQPTAYPVHFSSYSITKTLYCTSYRTQQERVYF